VVCSGDVVVYRRTTICLWSEHVTSRTRTRRTTALSRWRSTTTWRDCVKWRTSTTAPRSSTRTFSENIPTTSTVSSHTWHVGQLSYLFSTQQEVSIGHRAVIMLYRSLHLWVRVWVAHNTG